MRELLVVEDHAESRSSLKYLLEQHGYRIHVAANGRAAVSTARHVTLHGLVLDLKLPDMDGLSVLRAIQSHQPGLPTVVVTGFGTIDAAVEAMKHGAADFLTKPIQIEGLLATLERAIAAAAEQGRVPPVKSIALADMERLGIYGRSQAMLALFEQLKRIAPYQSTVLLSGESGTGKELIARALHAMSPRSSGPFVPINCASLSEEMLENDLFGHERGAFTSADRSKAGVMETADRGSLFLDEVSEMGMGCQAKLLRALERREFRRVGGTQKIHVDVNLVAACNVDLAERVTAGRFREDLLYRLNVVSIRVPPLRDRPDAIGVLATVFLDEVARRTGMHPKRLSAAARTALEQYDWPGNVRELRNCMESLTLLSPRETIEPDDLPPNIVHKAPALELRFRVGTPLAEVELELIRATLAASASVKEAAQTLGIPVRTFHEKLRRLGLRKSK